MDARMDGMVYASIEHSPVIGGKLKSYDDKAPLQVAGVRQTVTIDPCKPPLVFKPLGGIAVIADNTWAAFQGRKKLNPVWDNGPIRRGTAREILETIRSRANGNELQKMDVKKYAKTLIEDAAYFLDRRGKHQASGG